MTDTMNAASEQATEIKNTATEGATAVAQEAKSKAIDVFGQTKNQLTHEANTQGQRLASSLQDVSKQLSAMAQSGEAGPVQDLASQAADALGNFANRLQSGGTDGLLRDLSGIARRKPGAFLLGAGVAGFVVTRLVRNGAMKASSSGSNALNASPSTVGGLSPFGGGSVAATPSTIFELCRMKKNERSACLPLPGSNKSRSMRR